MKFEKGQMVRVVSSDEKEIYSNNAEGFVIKQDDNDGLVLVQFKNGKFSKKKVAYQATAKGQWWVRPVELELIEEKEKQMEGYGNFVEGDGLGSKSSGNGIYVTKGWAVEVNGDIDVNMVTDTRGLARSYRNDLAQQGYKASVRKVEIKVLKGKI